MNIGLRFNLLIASASLVVALISSGCAMMTPKAERYVAPPLGSTWTQTYHSTGSYGSAARTATIRTAKRTWKGKRYLAFVAPTGTILANPADGAWSTILTPNGSPIVSYDPPAGYEYPLAVGKTWTQSIQVTVHKANKTQLNQINSRVESYEDVTVPAGTFKAFKVRQQWFLNSKLTLDNIDWFAPELGIFVKSIHRRTADSVFGPGTRETEVISQTITK